MRYQIAGIDVHKKMLAVVVANGEVEGDYQFERRKVGTSPDERLGCANCASVVPLTVVGITVRGERTFTVWRCGECLHLQPVEI